MPLLWGPAIALQREKPTGLFICFTNLKVDFFHVYTPCAFPLFEWLFSTWIIVWNFVPLHSLPFL